METARKEPSPAKEDGEQRIDIVIAGVSCRLPESDNVEEFWQHLIRGEDMVTEDGRRWPPGMYGLPKRNGKLKDLTKFDAEFFHVNPLQAHAMDPQLRILLEVVYETLVDAGINPSELRGSRTGVFVGSMFAEALEVSGSLQAGKRVGYGLTGAVESMFANYVSFCFDFKGPSVSVNTGCSASLYAFDLAVQSIRTGQCEHALVAGTNILVKPGTAMHMHRLGMLSPDGSCKAFDESANGYVRSEGIAAVLLSPGASARRAYLRVLNSKSSCDGYKLEGITYPSSSAQKELIISAFSEIGVRPDKVYYIEAHGTGTQAGDFEECKALDEAICTTRAEDPITQPLLVGSVKSNMGHSEPSSGLSGIVKVLLSFVNGTLPPNLHFKAPNPRIPSLTENRLSVVSEATPLPSGAIVGLNSFGFGGAISHIVLQGVTECPANETDNVTLAYPLSSRTKEGLEKLMDFVTTHRRNKDLLTLLSSMKDTSHAHRGYILWDKNSDIQKVSVDTTSEQRPPVWLVFDGMGTQWSRMGKDLMQYPLFAQTMKRCYSALPSAVRNVFSSAGKIQLESRSIVDDVTAVCAITLSLYELLRAVGIVPDGLIGHSLGELTLCYADGSLTLEQCIQVAYWRVRCVVEAKVGRGAMAVVGLSWEETKSRCPEGVWACCNNGKDCVTISGGKDAIDKFVAQMQKEGVFVRMVNSAGLPFHSPMMQPAVSKKTFRILEEIIPKPKPASPKWIVTSTSPKKDPQQHPILCSAQFHIDSLVKPVHFYKALQKIPKDAIVLEVGPHALLQAILKRNLSSETTIIPLQNWKEGDQSVMFMRALGECHNAGVSINPMALLGEISFPVSPKTPSISHLVAWEHSDEWFVPKPEDFVVQSSTQDISLATATFKIDLTSGNEDDFTGYRINGGSMLPAAYYLHLVWKTLAKYHSKPHTDFPISFADIKFHKFVSLESNTHIQLSVLVSPVSGYFEVTAEGKSLVTSGKVTALTNKALEYRTPAVKSQISSKVKLTKQELYKELHLKGYHFSSQFQILTSADINATQCSLELPNSSSPYLAQMDALFQVAYLHTETLSLPSSIHILDIDPRYTESHLTIHSNASTGDHSTGNTSIKGLQLTPLSRKRLDIHPLFQSYTFEPYFQYSLEEVDSTLTQLKTMLDIVIENTDKHNLTILQIVRNNDPQWKATNLSLVSCISKISQSYPTHEIRHDIIFVGSHSPDLQQLPNKGNAFWMGMLNCFTPFKIPYDLVIAENLGPKLNVNRTEPHLLKQVSPGGFLLFKESLSIYGSSLADSPQKCISEDLRLFNFCCVARKHCNNVETDSENVFLLYRQVDTVIVTDSDIAIVLIEAPPTLTWVPELLQLLSVKNNKRIYCISECDNDNPSGLIGMANCLKLESYRDRLRCLLLFDTKFEDFRSTMVWQWVKTSNLFMNVVKDGKVGSFWHLPLLPSTEATDDTDNAPSTPLSNPAPKVVATDNTDNGPSTSPRNPVVATDDADNGPSTSPRNPAPKVVATDDADNGPSTSPRNPVVAIDDADNGPSTSPRNPAPKVASSDPADVSSSSLLLNSDKYLCLPDKSYIITGGLGGFGLELAAWLVSRGAKHLILTSRSGVKTGYQTRKLDILRSQGASIKVSKLNVSNVFQAFELVKKALNTGHGLGGIFHLAVVLKDALFENQTVESFEAVLNPKLVGAIFLDKATRSLTPNPSTLFVVFSSVSSGLGNAGQSNYAFANSAMERICEQRSEDNLHGLAIQWGAIADVGLLQDKTGKIESIAGTILQPISSCLESLDVLLSCKHPVVSCYVPAETQSSQESATSNQRSSNKDLKTSLCRILGLQNPEKLKLEATLNQLGVDSMMSFEVRQLLAKDYSLDLSAKELLSTRVSTLIERTSSDLQETVLPESTDNLGDTSVNSDAASSISPTGSATELVNVRVPKGTEE